MESGKDLSREMVGVCPMTYDIPGESGCEKKGKFYLPRGTVTPRPHPTFGRVC